MVIVVVAAAHFVVVLVVVPEDGVVEIEVVGEVACVAFC